MEERRVLVTGGAGFLGSHLCRRLIAEHCHVIALDSFYTGRIENVRDLLDHPRFELVGGDVRLPLEGKVDEIYNLACPASPVHYQRDPIHTTLTSVVGGYHALLLAERTGARLLQASTSEVYGDPEVHPQPEQYRGSVSPIGPRACYDEGKRCAESLVMDFVRAGRADVRIARIFNTYGPAMAPEDGRVVSNFIMQALNDQPLTVYGDGTQTRSLCYVSDTIEGILRLMRSDVIGPVNIGNPHELAVLEIANEVIRMVGGGSIDHHPLPKDDPQRRRPDIELAKRELGFEPQVGFHEGLEETVRYFRAYVRARQLRRNGAVKRSRPGLSAVSARGLRRPT